MKAGDETPNYYPISLNISGKKCVVVGGGQVALRKVKTLIEHGATVRVISSDLCSELTQLKGKGKISVLTREYQTGDLQDAVIAIAATSDNDTNSEVAREAQGKAILVNVVDDADSSDFIAPSYLRRGPVTITISTAGRSPALARHIRARLEKEFGDEYASLALLLNEVRTEVKRQGIKINADAWQEVLDLDSLGSLLKRGEREEAMAILLSNLEKSNREDGLA